MRNRRLISIVAASCVVAIVCFAVVFALFGADYLTSNYGPANVWFISWEGEVSIPDPQAPFTLVLKPAHANPSVVAIHVASAAGAKAVFRTPSGVLVRLPEDANQLRVFDWYNGDLTLEYVPEEVSETEEVRVQWKFGYE